MFCVFSVHFVPTTVQTKIFQSWKNNKSNRRKASYLLQKRTHAHCVWKRWRTTHYLCWRLRAVKTSSSIAPVYRFVRTVSCILFYTVSLSREKLKHHFYCSFNRDKLIIVDTFFAVPLAIMMSCSKKKWQSMAFTFLKGKFSTSSSNPFRFHFALAYNMRRWPSGRVLACRAQGHVFNSWPSHT